MRFSKIIWLEKTDSTQNEAKEKNLSYNTVVVSKIQKRGRGRSGNTWISQQGGLYFSILLNPNELKHTDQLSILIGLTISEYLEKLGVPASIKWPNDIYCKGKKICGILSEKTGKSLIVGIGLNVNQESFPEKVEAISLYNITGKKYALTEIFLGLLSSLNKLFEELPHKDFSDFKNRIEEKLIYKGSEIIVKSDPPVVGILQGISEKGNLLVLTSEGIKEISGGEFTLRPVI